MAFPSSRRPRGSNKTSSRRPQGTSEAGSSAVEGLAIGRAILWENDPEPQSEPGSLEEERARLARAHVRASRGVDELVRLLSPIEAELFLPEVAILAELGPILFDQVSRGATAEQAILKATSRVSTDLLLDARARLLDGLVGQHRSVESLLEGREGDLVLVTHALTASVVASLPPRVVGIVAADNGHSNRAQSTSHAVILARGRGIPVAFVHPEFVLGVDDGAMVLVDTTKNVARVWIEPGEPTLIDARRRQSEQGASRPGDESKVASPLTHLGVEVNVNIGSVRERFPPSAGGIGLLRTELVFASHGRPPSELEQLAALRAIAGPVGQGHFVVRLFDAGGDKPLPWLKAPDASPDARGVHLLFMHPEILETQLRAIVRAAEHSVASVLLPLVRGGDDIERIRTASRGKVPVGAMVETPDAADRIDEIAGAADFVCIGTNDLFSLVVGRPREDAVPLLDARGLRLVERVVRAAHAHGRKVSVCGELAADLDGARILVGLGIDSISVAPARFANVKVALHDTTLDDCQRAARSALA